MLNLLLSWLILSVIVYLTALIVPGVRVNGFSGALWVAAIFGILNWAIGWLLYVVIGVASLGLGFLLAFLTRWLVNTIVLKLTDALTTKLTITRFSRAALAALLMAALASLADLWLRSGVAGGTFRL